MSSFIFNGFKERFLNGKVPSSFNAVFLPMNNKFINNFSTGEFSIEQFRTTDDLEKYNNNLLNDSKLKYVGIENSWSAITETEEQNKPMYVNIDNWNEFIESEYWADCSANKHINEYKNNGFYILRTKEEFNWFANEVNEGNNGITGVLFDDVSDKISFTIGNDETIPFQGVLDGNGHSLKNAFYVCTGSDNGLVSVLGAKGIVRNFILSNKEYVKDNGMSPTLKGRKQINLNYLKNDARDVNAGLLVGRNYGTIENILLSGSNEDNFTFSFSGFVPQVYSVSNKSDDVSDFTSIRKKFDDGENFYFLNSWCLNSPGNICPYVGYFAEGIFAQKAIGYNVTGTPEAACIEYAPKMKSYYDTGSEEVYIDLTNATQETQSDPEIPVIKVLAIFIKYNWCSDYLFTHGHGINSLEYVYSSTSDTDDKELVYLDNMKYRSYKVSTKNKDDIIEYDGMTEKELSVLRSDPEWYSFNDDPRGRNAVAIVQCVYKGKNYFLELNGMYTTTDAGEETQTQRFIAGSLDLSQLEAPVIDSEPPEDKKEYYTAIPKEYTYNSSRTYWVSKGYGMHDNNLYRARHDDANYEHAKNVSLAEKSKVDIPVDLTDSIRVFDENGNQVKVNSCEGFTCVWHSVRSRSYTAGDYSDNVNTHILTNVVYKTDIDINLPNEVVNGPLNGCKIRFASKLLFPYKLNSDTNRTHEAAFNNSSDDFDNMFSWAEPGLSDMRYFSKTYQAGSLFPKEGKDHSVYIHANDYKQYIASNYSIYCKPSQQYYSKYEYSGIVSLFRYFAEFPKRKDYKKEEDYENEVKYFIPYIKLTFEKVDERGVHHLLTDDEVKNDTIRDAIFRELTDNLSKYLKNEVDYTNTSYASQWDKKLPLGGDGNHNGISRHFLFSYFCDKDFNPPEWRPIIINYLKNRDYRYLMQENSDDQFYSKPIDYDTGDIVNFDELMFDYKHDVLIPQQKFDRIGGLLILETFNYNKFQYAPFVSCSKIDGEGNVDSNTFEAGAVYDTLIRSPGGFIHDDWVQRAAELYVKNPVYYGLDYNGHWTSMAVRTSDVAEDKINQVNYNWNIMRAMYEGIPEDPDKPDGELLWPGIYYDDYVFPDNDTHTWKCYTREHGVTGEIKDYDDQYSDASMIPNCMLNKPIRMHHMVRAAYNIAPIVGANYGTVSSISGNVDVYKHPDSNFVGFIGTVAGKNVNGLITDVNLKIKYDLNDTTKHYVKYKNTPLLPYSVTKNMNIPLNPDNVDFKYYSVLPNTAYIENSDKENYKDLLTNVNCISFYDKTDYKNNPDYVQDKKYYDEVKYFSYFTSAWYDEKEQKDDVTDDVISYQLKPVFVVGGLVGKVVASRACDNNSNVKKTKIHNTVLSIDNNIPFNKENVDIHSTYGSIVGQVDIQTTDTDYNKTEKLIELDTITVADNNGNVPSKFPTFGYVEYQPIDMNTVVALSNRPRNKKNDYSGPYEHVLYAIDIPFNFDTGGKDSKYSYDKYEYANINQSSGAFINNTVESNVAFDACVECKNVYDFTGSSKTNRKYCFDKIDSINGNFGLQSTNSVLGSNTLFIPAIYPFEDTTKPIYDTWKNIGGPNISIQEVLYDPNNFNVTRYYFRGMNQSEYKSSQNNQSVAPVIKVRFNNDSFSDEKNEDKYFSYTYSSSIIDNEKDAYEFDTLSAKMFNNIPVNFCNVVDELYDITKCYYIADFGNQSGMEGDDINYSGNNYLVFGQSLSPTEIRKQINAAKDNPTPFISTLFSAYQYIIDDDGTPEMEEDGTHKKMEATSDYQLGGFLVIEKSDTNPATTGGNLVMFVNNDNNAEIDGRSYNLGFKRVKEYKKVMDADDKNNTEGIDKYESIFVPGGVLVHVKGK